MVISIFYVFWCLKMSFLQKKSYECALFFQKIWSYQKKAVPLHPLSKRKCDITIGAVVQLVRIHACHAWGRGFESRPHREEDANASSFVFMHL